MGLHLGLDFLQAGEISTLQEGGLGLVRLEERTHGLGDGFGLCVFLAEEDVHGYVFQVAVNLQGDMAFFQNAHQGVVIIFDLFTAQADETGSVLGEALLQGFLDEIYVGKLTVLAVIQIHRQVPCIKFHEPNPPYQLYSHKVNYK